MKRSEREWKVLKQCPRALAQMAYRAGESIDYNPYPMDDPRWADFQAEMQYLYCEWEMTKPGEP